MGERTSDVIDEGSCTSPDGAWLSEGARYRNRFFAAGDVFGVTMRDVLRSRRCI
jgi:hypothetical protein